jgi:hypothetical protein
MSGLVLSLCDRTGNMVKPWLDAGYDAVTFDLQEPANEHPRREHYCIDVRDPLFDWSAFSPIALFAFPPCTDLAVSGARWFKDKGLDALIDALQLVNACRRICEASGAPWMLENPVGTLATYWRSPDFTFDPCDFGDPYTKRTCLWIGGGFTLPLIVRPGDLLSEPTWVEPHEGSKIHLMPPSNNRTNLRSETPKGFAEAVFRANAPHLKRPAA